MNFVRSIFSTATEMLGDRPGVVEVHLCQKDISIVRKTTIGQFLFDWDHGCEIQIGDNAEHARFVGVVHEDGCYLVLLDGRANDLFINTTETVT